MTFSRIATTLSLMLASSFAILASDARADLPADSKAVFQQRFEDLGQHFQGGSLARWSNAQDRPALEKVWDVPTVLGRPPYPARDVSILAQIIKAQAELLEKYTKAGGAVPGSPKEARVRAKYQDEIVRNSAFLVTASAAMLEAIGDFATTLKPEDLKPARREGLERGRRGVRTIIEGLDAELRFPGVSTENRMLLLDAFAAHAPTIAAYSPAEDRKSYVEAAKATLAGLSDAEKMKLQVFISAMETKECKGLCALKG